MSSTDCGGTFVVLCRQICSGLLGMKTLTVRLPEALVNQIEAESRARRLSKSDIVRERLAAAPATGRRQAGHLEAIADLIGSVEGLPEDLSSAKKSQTHEAGLWPQASSLTQALPARGRTEKANCSPSSSGMRTSENSMAALNINGAIE